MKSTYSLALIVAAGSMLTTITPLRASEADKSINHAIFNLLMANGSLAPGPVSFETQDGIVTITGTSLTHNRKDQLDNVIAKLPGVHSIVDDRAVVSTEPTQPDSAAKSQKMDDMSMTYQLKSALMSHNSTANTVTEIVTKNGVVMISGVAKSEAERNRTTQLAAGIDGVTSVINNMTVEVAAN